MWHLLANRNPPEVCQEPLVIQGSNLEMLDRRLNYNSWHPRLLKFEMWHLQATRNIQKVCQEPPVLQGSNLEMVDRGLLDRVSDILDTWNLKCDTSRLQETSRECVRNHLSSKDPTWRWWIGSFLTGFLTFLTPEIWNEAPPGHQEPSRSVSGTTCPPRIQPGDSG